MKYLLTTILVIAGAACAALGQCSDSDKQALEAFDKAWGAASTSGNRAELMNIYADEFMAMPQMLNKTASIDNAVKAAEHNRAKPSGDKVTPDHYFISCTPTTATITHRNTIWTPMGADGKPETFYTRSIHFLEKRGGKWLAVSNAGGGQMGDGAIVWYLEQDWNDAFLKRNKEWFDGAFAPEFISISSGNGAITNKDEEIASIIGDKATYNVVETKDMNIRIEGNTALVTGIFHLAGKDEKGAAFDNNIRYTDAWIKRDGHWVAWSSHGTKMQ